MVLCAGIAQAQGAGPGTLDSSFSSTQTGTSIARTTDGKILLGSNDVVVSSGPLTTPQLKRLNANGSLDSNFGVPPDLLMDEVLAIAVQSDGKIIVEGMSRAGGSVPTLPHARLVRLHPTGIADSTFTPSDLSSPFDRTFSPRLPQTVIIQPDGKILALQYSNGVATLVRLEANGQRDHHFGQLNTPAGPAPVSPAFTLAPDGSIFVIGWINRGEFVLSRLNSDGSLGAKLKTDFTMPYYWQPSLAVLPSGKLMVAGYIQGISGGQRSDAGVVRLLSSGALDPTFSLVTGARHTGSLVIQADGRFFLEGVRYTADGLVDRGFSSSNRSGPAHLQADGKLLISDGTRLYRYYNSATTSGVFALSHALIWINGGASPMVDEVLFYDAAGVLLGRGTPVGTVAWRLDGVAIAPGDIVKVRALQHQGARANSAYEWILTAQGDAARPEVQFGSAGVTSFREGTTATVKVTLSSIAPEEVRVPLTIGGTATPINDFILNPVLSVVFSPGEVEKTVDIRSVNDQTPEPDETVDITLGTPIGNASLSGPSALTMTILNDDFDPVVVSGDESQFLGLGGPWQFNLVVDHSENTIAQWYKDGRPLGASFAGSPTVTLSGDAAKPSDSGTYKLRLQSATKTVWSASFKAAVDTTNIILTFREGGPFNVQLPAWGDLTYQWTGPGISNATVSAKGSTLTKARVTASDIGDYTCHLSLPSGTGVDVTVITQFSTSAPVVTQGAIAGRVTVPLDIELAYSADRSPPTKWNVTGLQKGLVVRNGHIVGTPEIGGFFPLTVSADNPSGKSASIVVPMTIKTLPLGSVGAFEGLLPTRPGTLLAREGRISLLVSEAGSCTGKLWIDGNSYPLMGAGTVIEDAALGDSEPQLALDLSISIPNGGTYHVTVGLGGASDDGLYYGQLASDVEFLVNFSLWPKSNNVTGSVGLQTVQLRHTSGLVGDGFAWLTVDARGTANWVMRGVDGSAMTASQALGDQGRLAVYHLISSGEGQISGILKMDGLGAVSGDLTHYKDSDAVDGPAFGAEKLSAVGARYVPPGSRGMVMKLPNSADNLLVSISNTTRTPISLVEASATVQPGCRVSVPKLRSLGPDRITALRLLPSNGGFSGTLEVVTPDPSKAGQTIVRVAHFQGLIVTPRDTVADGRGFVWLPRLRDLALPGTPVLYDSLPVRIAPAATLTTLQP